MKSISAREAYYTEIHDIEENLVGKVVGKGSARISELKRVSRCDIEIRPNKNGRPKIKYSGTKQQIYEAKLLVLQISQAPDNCGECAVHVLCFDVDTGKPHVLWLVGKMSKTDPSYFIRNSDTGEIERVRDKVKVAYDRVRAPAYVSAQAIGARALYRRLKGLGGSVVDAWRALSTEEFHFSQQAAKVKNVNIPSYFVSLGPMTKDDRLEFCQRYRDIHATNRSQLDAHSIYFSSQVEDILARDEFKEKGTEDDRYGAPDGDIDGKEIIINKLFTFLQGYFIIFYSYYFLSLFHVHRGSFEGNVQNRS